jgi:DNA-binding FadR family transcriptional regulator
VTFECRSNAPLKLIESWGRRPLIIWCFALMAIPLFVLGLFPSAPLAIIANCFVAYALFSGGPSILEWAYPSEIFPTHVRASAVGITTAVSRIGVALGTLALPFGRTTRRSRWRFSIPPAVEMAAQVRTQGQDISDRAEQVTLQLESAIGMGLLNSGERLPPQSVMAEHLGVSPLALCTTPLPCCGARGSWAPAAGAAAEDTPGVLPVREAEIAQQLRRHKSNDLRDLIDLAAATAGSAARLASRRSDEQDVRRLRKLAQRYASSSEPHMLRQADARLHIGLGVAAQSRRLTALLIQIHAELSPLTWCNAWLDGQPTSVEEHERCWTPAPGHPHLRPGGPAVKPSTSSRSRPPWLLGRAWSGYSPTWQSWPEP